MKIWQLIFAFSIFLYQQPGWGNMIVDTNRVDPTSNNLLLELRINPGLAPIEDQVFVLCQIFPKKTVITKGVGGIYRKSVQPHQLVGKISSLIAKAGKGTIISNNSPVDLPTTTYTAFSQAPFEVAEVKLFSRVFAGDMIYRNESSAAKQLVNFLDVNCNF